VPIEVKAAMTLRLDDVEQQLREMTCAEVLTDSDLGWTFEGEVDDWSISIVLRRAVERRGDMLLVPLACQARKGRGFLGHRDSTVSRTVELHCE
jgi:hypothetical protein